MYFKIYVFDKEKKISKSSEIRMSCRHVSYGLNMGAQIKWIYVPKWGHWITSELICETTIYSIENFNYARIIKNSKLYIFQFYILLNFKKTNWPSLDEVKLVDGEILVYFNVLWLWKRLCIIIIVLYVFILID